MLVFFFQTKILKVHASCFDQEDVKSLEYLKMYIRRVRRLIKMLFFSPRSISFVVVSFFFFCSFFKWGGGPHRDCNYSFFLNSTKIYQSSLTYHNTFFPSILYSLTYFCWHLNWWLQVFINQRKYQKSKKNSKERDILFPALISKLIWSFFLLFYFLYLFSVNSLMPL